MADTIEKPATDAGYETDFYLWTQQQAAALRDAARMRVNAPIDWENVAEEIESVGGSDRREVESLASHILIHLVKLAASPSDLPRNGWRREIRAAREKLERVLRMSPTLRQSFADIVETEWAQALADAREDLEEHGEGEQAAATIDALKQRGPRPGEVTERSFYPAIGQV